MQLLHTTNRLPRQFPCTLNPSLPCVQPLQCTGGGGGPFYQTNLFSSSNLCLAVGGGRNTRPSAWCIVLVGCVWIPLYLDQAQQWPLSKSLPNCSVGRFVFYWCTCDICPYKGGFALWPWLSCYLAMNNTVDWRSYWPNTCPIVLIPCRSRLIIIIYSYLLFIVSYAAVFMKFVSLPNKTMFDFFNLILIFQG